MSLKIHCYMPLASLNGFFGSYSCLGSFPFIVVVFAAVAVICSRIKAAKRRPGDVYTSCALLTLFVALFLFRFSDGPFKGVDCGLAGVLAALCFRDRVPCRLGEGFAAAGRAANLKCGDRPRSADKRILFGLACAQDYDRAIYGYMGRRISCWQQQVHC